MENLKNEVLAGFEIIPKAIIKSKHSYICKTSRGTKVIQKTAAKEKSVIAAHKIKTLLEEGGFPVYDKFYMSNQGTPFFSLDDEKYIMTDFKDFDESDFSNADDVKEVIKAAAYFHKLSKNIDVGFEPNINILKTYERQFSVFKNIKKNISSKGSLSEFDVIFIKNYDYFFKRAKSALDALNNIFGNFRFDKKILTLCHNNIKEETAVKYKGNMSLIYFENCTAGLFISDFSDIINRYVRKHTPPALNFDDILEAYFKINPLSKADVELLRAILRFPSKYMKICCDFYSKGMPFVPNSVVNHLKRIISQKSIYESYTESGIALN